MISEFDKQVDEVMWRLTRERSRAPSVAEWKRLYAWAHAWVKAYNAEQRERSARGQVSR